MTALTVDRQEVVPVSTRTREFPVLAAATVYKGSFVGRLPTGYVRGLQVPDEFVGVAVEQANNSNGSSGDTSVNAASDFPGQATKQGLIEVYTEGDFEFSVSGVAVTDAGKPVYATNSGDLALTGHPDCFVGTILHRSASGKAIVRLRRPGEMPPQGVGSVLLELSGYEAFAETGATAGTATIGAFDFKTILGLGATMSDTEDGGILGTFDATAEVALASLRTRNDCLPIDKGLTFDVELCVTDKGDATALDIDWGFGTALTTNSEASIDHADMVQLAAFHMDGNSDDVLAQSDDNTTDVAAVDTTINNDSTTDVAKKYKIVVRPTGSVEFYCDSGSGFARLLSSTTFAMLSSANVAAFINMEKTSDDTTAVILFRKLRIAAGMAA